MTKKIVDAITKKLVSQGESFESESLRKFCSLHGVAIDQNGHWAEQLLLGLLEHYSNLRKRNITMKQVFEVKRAMKSFGASCRNIDFATDISYEDFKTNYLLENKPLIIRKFAMDWPAIGKWSLDFFSKHYGGHPIEIMANRVANPNYEVERDSHRYTITFTQFIDSIRVSNSNDLYLTANNNFFNEPLFAPLIEDLIEKPGYFEKPERLTDLKLWMGPKGTITPLHYDTTNLLLVQIAGKKRIKMISPDHTHILQSSKFGYSEIDLNNPDSKKFSNIDKLTIHEVILDESDALFIPVLWWHYVESLEASISVTHLNLKPNIYINKSGYSLIN